MAEWDVKAPGDQFGKLVVITGGNSGVGLEAGRALARCGANVVLACRDPERAETARESISEGAQGSVSTIALDLADLDSVADCAKRLAGDHEHIDALVLNAGIMGGHRGDTAQGHERQMGTNHLGHFALTAQLWPQLSAAPEGRVVPVSSLASRGGKLDASMTRETLVDPPKYKANTVYSNTKQANLLFAQELHRRAREAGSAVRSIAVHPGVSGTALFGRQLREQGFGFLAPIGDQVVKLAFQSAAAGAWPTVRAVCDPDVESGAFVAPTGLFGSRGKPKVIDLFSVGTDEQAAKRLWELSEDITGVPFRI